MCDDHDDHPGGVPGGWGKPKKPTKDEQDILEKVKKEFEKKSGMNPCKFEGILVCTQVVAGTNYCFRVDVGSDKYYDIKVFQSLPYANQEPSLKSFQAAKSKDAKFECF